MAGTDTCFFCIMAVTRLLLIRHGQSGGNVNGRFGGHSDTPLSELGCRQAEITADLLESVKIGAIYSSDLPRAVQTAEPLVARTGLELNKTSAFRERNVGVLEGLTFEESKERYPDDYYALVKRDVNHVITEGESYRELLSRGTGALEEILRTHMGKRIVVFSHTGMICYLTLYLIGAINRNTRQTPWLVTSNCGINRFEIRGRRNIRVKALNDTRHLIDTTGNNSFAGGKY
ncbi:MAG: histidine phosphatase family protein [Pyrinomonadaceae bacterium]|nr:histidine phosphatase family protein [Pyrinomonadaceae bacterium]